MPSRASSQSRASANSINASPRGSSARRDRSHRGGVVRLSSVHCAHAWAAAWAHAVAGPIGQQSEDLMELRRRTHVPVDTTTMQILRRTITDRGQGRGCAVIALGVAIVTRHGGLKTWGVLTCGCFGIMVHHNKNTRDAHLGILARRLPRLHMGLFTTFGGSNTFLGSNQHADTYQAYNVHAQSALRNTCTAQRQFRRIMVKSRPTFVLERRDACRSGKLDQELERDTHAR
eukprot:358027-Chlamydomonas_euryale.AAC.1